MSNTDNQSLVSAMSCRHCNRTRGELHGPDCPLLGGLERHAIDTTRPAPFSDSVDYNMTGLLALALAVVTIGGLLWTL